MQEKGLRLRRVSLTAKDRICFLPERLCNPDDCPYAKGYYDRVQDVLFEMLKQEDAFTRPVIERWAKRASAVSLRAGTGPVALVRRCHLRLQLPVRPHRLPAQIF